MNVDYGVEMQYDGSSKRFAGLTTVKFTKIYVSLSFARLNA